MLTVPVDDLALHLSVVHTSWAERKSDFLLQIPCQYTALRVQPTIMLRRAAAGAGTCAGFTGGGAR